MSLRWELAGDSPHRPPCMSPLGRHPRTSMRGELADGDRKPTSPTGPHLAPTRAATARGGCPGEAGGELVPLHIARLPPRHATRLCGRSAGEGGPCYASGLSWRRLGGGSGSGNFARRSSPLKVLKFSFPTPPQPQGVRRRIRRWGWRLSCCCACLGGGAGVGSEGAPSTAPCPLHHGPPPLPEAMKNVLAAKLRRDQRRPDTPHSEREKKNRGGTLVAAAPHPNARRREGPQVDDCGG